MGVTRRDLLTLVQDCGRDHDIGWHVHNAEKGLDNSGTREGSLHARFSPRPGSSPHSPARQRRLAPRAGVGDGQPAELGRRGGNPSGRVTSGRRR